MKRENARALDSPVELGRGYSIRFFSYRPSADKPHLQPVDRFGATLICPHGAHSFFLDCGIAHMELHPDRPRWSVLSWEPLTLTPSLNANEPGDCGCHGRVTEGRWEPA